MKVGSVVKITTMIDDYGNFLLGVVEYTFPIQAKSVVRYCYANEPILHNNRAPDKRLFDNKNLTVVKE